MKHFILLQGFQVQQTTCIKPNLNCQDSKDRLHPNMEHAQDHVGIANLVMDLAMITALVNWKDCKKNNIAMYLHFYKSVDRMQRWKSTVKK